MHSKLGEALRLCAFVPLWQKRIFGMVSTLHLKRPNYEPEQ